MVLVVRHASIRVPERCFYLLMKCKNCQTKLNKRQFKYCSNKCQQSLHQEQKLKKWLLGFVVAVSSQNNHYIRKYILKTQNKRCAICDMKDRWKDKKLVFVMDHINGNSSDSSVENLRMICPNCDSQLETYKSKNKGNGRHYRKIRYTQGKSY